jgi:hypothetical protein
MHPRCARTCCTWRSFRIGDIGRLAQVVSEVRRCQRTAAALSTQEAELLTF